MAVKKSNDDSLVIKPISQGKARLRIIGVTPMYQNRMGAKAKQHLLLGKGKKTKAERADIKHNPLFEFRDAAEIAKSGPTALGLRVVAVKAAMCTAALETEGITKTSTQRLLFMPGELFSLYGIPQLKMDVVRSADINKTPDIRTRAFLPKWGAEIDVQFVTPQFNVTSVVQLLCNAGILVGLGDNRQEKGKGAYGSFRVIGPDDQDAEWDELVAFHGREAQLAALKNPEFADDETRDLYEAFEQEWNKRAA